jgi:hypothetical protein
MAQKEIKNFDEKLRLAVKSIELKKQGKLEESERVRKQIPILNQIRGRYAPETLED